MRPMSNFYWTVGAVCIFYLPFASDAQLRPREIVQVQTGVWGNKEKVYRAVYQVPPKATYAQNSGSGGFNSSVRPRPPVQVPQAQAEPTPAPTVNVQVPKSEPPVVNVPAPVVNVAPPVVNVAPPQVTVSPTLSAGPATWLEEIKSWLIPILLGWIGIAVTKGVVKPPVTPYVSVPSTATAVGADGLPAEAGLLLKLRDKIGDHPDIKARIDEALLAAVSTGIPGRVVQTGFSAIPVPGAGIAGGFAQPLLEKAFVKFLESRLAVNTKDSV